MTPSPYKFFPGNPADLTGFIHDALIESVTFYNVKDKDDVPKTGDGFPKLLIIGLAAIGLVGIGTCIWIKKKL